MQERLVPHHTVRPARRPVLRSYWSNFPRGRPAPPPPIGSTGGPALAVPGGNFPVVGRPIDFLA